MSIVVQVKVNAVRASGNLLKILNSNGNSYCLIFMLLKLQIVIVPCSSGSNVTIMCSLLTEAVNNGGMKTRWNACYACHNALKNDYFTSNFEQSTVKIKLKFSHTQHYRLHVYPN